MSTDREKTTIRAGNEAETAASAPPADGEGDKLSTPPEAEKAVPDPVEIFNSWCKGCGICVAFCPTKTLALSPATGKCIIVLAEACSKCGLCELRCPDFAITVILNGARPR